MYRDDVTVSADDTAIFFILSKMDQYKSETHYYEHKYKKSLHEVEDAQVVTGQDGFQLQEDLQQWESAVSSLEFWENKYQSMLNA